MLVEEVILNYSLFMAKDHLGYIFERAHVLSNSGHLLFTIDRESKDYDRTTKIFYQNVGFIFICNRILLVLDLFV